MAWLTAILAFATTMLMLAMLVSTLVEMVHRIIGARVSGMKKLLKNFFTEFGVSIPATIKATADGVKIESKSFAEKILEKKATANSGNSLVGSKWRGLDHLSLPVFMQKLAVNIEFDAAKTEKEIEKIAADIAQKFEAFGQEMSEAFERRARLMSVIIAIAIAFLFNVDALYIARTYLDEPERAAAIAEKADDLVKQFEEAEKAAAAKRAEAAQPAAAGSTDGQAAGATGQGQAGAKDPAAPEKALLEELKAFRAKIDTERLPIGWTDMGPDGKPVPDCAAQKGQAPSSQSEPVSTATPEGTVVCVWWRPLGIPLLWPSSPAKFFWLLMGGLLVGLGAPYWARVVSSLLALRDGSRKIAEIVAPESLAPGGVGKSVAVEAFMTAYKAKAAVMAKAAAEENAIAEPKADAKEKAAAKTEAIAAVKAVEEAQAEPEKLRARIKGSRTPKR